MNFERLDENLMKMFTQGSGKCGIIVWVSLRKLESFEVKGILRI